MPFFTAQTDGVPAYSIQVAAGRWLVLLVFGTLGYEPSAQAHEAAMARRDLFNDADAAFFGVSVDPNDQAQRGLANAAVGVRYFWDFDKAVCGVLGLMDGEMLTPGVFLIDPSFRVAMVEPLENTALVLDRLEQELAAKAAAPDTGFAPVLTLPRIFEPEFCAELIAYFQAHEPEESGFAADVDGRTVNRIDPNLKRRHDVTVEDPDLLARIDGKLRGRLLPMIKRAFNWQATEIERFVICRYAAEDRGFFFPHRDDVTAGTAHRKFAVTINLNAEDYEGGDLRFPEFGRRSYRTPTGGATAFCCSLLHEAMPVTEGVRYAFVPFLYDEAGAKVRRANAVQSQGNRSERRAAKGRGVDSDPRRSRV